VCACVNVNLKPTVALTQTCVCVCECELDATVLGEMCLSTEEVVDAALFDARQAIGHGNAC
jgi:hypothetical protein